MTTKSTPGVTHLSRIYEQGWRMVVRAMDLPGTGALPGFVCKSLSPARPGPHHASLQSPLIRGRGKPQRRWRPPALPSSVSQGTDLSKLWQSCSLATGFWRESHEKPKKRLHGGRREEAKMFIPLLASDSKVWLAAVHGVT